jgi:hypothetical protein
LTGTIGKLRKLKRQEVERLRDRFVARFKPEDLEDQACVSVLQEPTRVDLPLGELLNPEMSELIKVWLVAGCAFIPGAITSQHQFCAQGIEGLVSVEPVPLNMALVAASRTGIYRIAIFVPRGWTCGFLQGASGFQDGASEQDRRGSEGDE